MNLIKSEFINILTNGLIQMPKEQRDDIISQYEEHFDIGISSGKSEHEIIQELGSPYEIVEKYNGNSHNNPQENEVEYTPSFKSEIKEPDGNYKNYTNNSYNNYESARNKKSEKSILLTIFLIIVVLILSPGIIGAFFATIAALFSGIIFSLALTFSSVLLFFAKLLNTGHLKDMLGTVLDQIPMASTIFFLIGNISLTILSFIIVIQIFKFLWYLTKKFFAFMKNLFN
jgi:uncharacterized membrane protein